MVSDDQKAEKYSVAPDNETEEEAAARYKAWLRKMRKIDSETRNKCVFGLFATRKNEIGIYCSDQSGFEYFCAFPENYAEGDVFFSDRIGWDGKIEKLHVALERFGKEFKKGMTKIYAKRKALR